MSAFDDLMNEINELTIARQVALPHDEAMLSFRLRSNVVADFDEFRTGAGSCSPVLDVSTSLVGTLTPSRKTMRRVCCTVSGDTRSHISIAY